MESIRDEPVTPAGRIFLQPKYNHIIHCAIGFKHPLNIEAIKTEFSNSVILKHPRFSGLLVVDKHGREFWRRTQIKFDDHFIVYPKNPGLQFESDEEQEEKINAILADFAVSSPLSTEKPLWELHLISELRCMIFRLHHALGDGISLMSLYLASCKRCNDNDDGNNISEKKGQNYKEVRKRRETGLMGILKMIWWTFLFVMGFIGRSLWVKDKKTALSGGDGVELWPRAVATAKFSLQDMKTIKRVIPKATINDVLFGVISSGFSKYLKSQSSLGTNCATSLHEGIQITGLAMVNLRKQPGLQELSKLMEDGSGATWGNKFGFMLLPVYYHTKDVDPLTYVKRAKVMIDQKKQSLEAHFTYVIGKLTMFLFGPKVTCMSNHKILCNTTFTISNVVGPQEESAFAGNPMTFIRVTTTSLPQAVTLHMVSYKGMANMQILAAKDIIPDPRLLAKCFEDALLEIKSAALASTNTIGVDSNV